MMPIPALRNKVITPDRFSTCRIIGRQHRASITRQGGFTLIEMMVAVSIIAIVLMAALGGCGSPVPRTHYYVLGPQDVSRTGTASEGLVIGVETFRVDPPYDQDKIVYRVGEDSVEVGFYPYHRWAAPLARMLPHVAAAAFDGVPGAKSIEAADSRRDYDAYLSGRVLVLEEVDSPDGQRARVRLALRLYADGGEIWSDTVGGTVGSCNALAPPRPLSGPVQLAVPAIVAPTVSKSLTTWIPVPT